MMCPIKCDGSLLVISKTHLSLSCTRALFEFLYVKVSAADANFAHRLAYDRFLRYFTRIYFY